MSRVLLVTIILTGRSGTEVVCCETARGLRRRNHEVVIYTQQDGPTADQLRARRLPGHDRSRLPDLSSPT